MTVALIDDQLLGSCLRGREPRVLRSKDLFTTGCWYVRLGQAVLRADAGRGRLGRPLHDQPEALRVRALDATLELPPAIGLLSFRELGPSIGRLRREGSLNLLAVEAVAVADRLGAEVHLSAPSPRLEEALHALGHVVRVHDPR